MKKVLTAVLYCVFLTLFGVISATAQTPTGEAAEQLDAKAQEAKNKIVKIGVGNDITIVDKDGNEFYGSVKEIGASSVSINEVDQKVKVEINYVRIKKVRKDYGATRGYNGKRFSPRRSFIGLAIGAAVIIIIPAIILATAKD